MPSHIYLRTGEYRAAVASNRAAVAADAEYHRERPVLPPGAAGYASHNLHFLAMSACMDGEFATAIEAARDLSRRSHSEHMSIVQLFVLARFGKWHELASLPEPAQAQRGLHYFWRFFRASGEAAMAQVPQAEEDQKVLENEGRDLPAGRAFGTLMNDWGVIRKMAGESLMARVALATGDTAGAIEYWRRAVGTEDRMVFDDLPDWYYPARESLGGALLVNGRAAEAESVFRADLAQNSRNPRSLYGLWIALQTQGRLPESYSVRAEFRSAWLGRELPVMNGF